MNVKWFFDRGYLCFHIVDNKYLVVDCKDEYVSIIAEHTLVATIKHFKDGEFNLKEGVEFAIRKLSIPR